MKAETTHYLSRALVQRSGQEVLGEVRLHADSPNGFFDWRHSSNKPFERMGSPQQGIAPRPGAVLSSLNNKTVPMSLFDSLLQRLHAFWHGNEEQRNYFLADERRAERKRIARELHDTLLQGLQGVLFEMELFSQTSALTEDQRERAANIEQKLRDIVVSGRDAIGVLRAPIHDEDWMAVIVDMGDRLSDESKIGFSLSVTGTPWRLKPTIRSEVLAIIREGMRNAFEHSQAKQIRVTLNYTKRRLWISIRDDGIGLSEQRVEDRRKEGHWGIAGMRERNDKLGGRLTITSQLAVGTTVNLFLPRHALFSKSPVFLMSITNDGAAKDSSRQ